MYPEFTKGYFFTMFFMTKNYVVFMQGLQLCGFFESATSTRRFSSNFITRLRTFLTLVNLVIHVTKLLRWQPQTRLPFPRETRDGM